MRLVVQVWVVLWEQYTLLPTRREGPLAPFLPKLRTPTPWQTTGFPIPIQSYSSRRFDEPIHVWVSREEDHFVVAAAAADEASQRLGPRRVTSETWWPRPSCCCCRPCLLAFWNLLLPVSKKKTTWTASSIYWLVVRE